MVLFRIVSYSCFDSVIVGKLFLKTTNSSYIQYVKSKMFSVQSDSAFVCFPLLETIFSIPVSMFQLCPFHSCLDFDIWQLLVSTYVVCERLSVMHKQVSGWTVNFCPNFPESPFLEFQTRNPPPHFGKLQIWDYQSLLRNTPPLFWKTSDLRWPKFTPEYPPFFGKLQIWNDQSLLWNTPPPISENFRFEMTKVCSGIPPPHFSKCGRSYVETNL